MHINDLLAKLVALGASDIHLHANMPPGARIEGKLQRFGQAKLTMQQLEVLPKVMCSETQQEMLEQEQQLDFAYSIANVARFRVNMFKQQGSVSVVLRVINGSEAQLARVQLPEGLLDYLCSQEKGLILVTGPTGSGKSSTLSRILDEINQRYPKMIVTIEDPIEYTHRPKQALIVQRERGRDVRSFSKALIAAMRQDPDVIMIGEIRDYETAKAAIEAAQTGHLVLSTLHTLDTVRTVNRIIDLFLLTRER
ncbi:MAG: PilT/PilU family type 4a pilus ATPase [Deinococcales bacterium]